LFLNFFCKFFRFVFIFKKTLPNVFFCRFVFEYIFFKNDEQLAQVRDKEGGREKFKLRYFETDDGKFGYPLVDDITVDVMNYFKEIKIK